MSKRKVEIFSAGCSVCDHAVNLVKQIACPSCDVIVVNMSDPGVADRAKELGIKCVPAVVVDGKVADCCSVKGVDAEKLKATGIGQSS